MVDGNKLANNPKTKYYFIITTKNGTGHYSRAVGQFCVFEMNLTITGTFSFGRWLMATSHKPQPKNRKIKYYFIIATKMAVGQFCIMLQGDADVVNYVTW